MSVIAPYQPYRNQYWPDIENFFTNLPPQLFRQGILLKNNLATFYAGTGQFRDILAREQDPPLFYYHLWLLDDWQIPQPAERTRLERHLFLAAVFNFVAVCSQEFILDEDSNFDNTYLFLGQRLRQQAEVHLAHLFSGDSPFWAEHQTIWADHAEASLVSHQPLTYEGGLSVEDVLAQLPQRLAYTKLPAIGTAIGVARQEQLPQLNQMLDHLNCVWQILRDVSTLRHDLARRRYSYPILKTIQAAQLDTNQPLVPEQVLGALALTGAMTEIGQTCTAQLNKARDLADLLKLPTFKEHCAVVEGLMAEVVDLFSLKAKSKKSTSEAKDSQRPIFAPFVETLPKVIEMAEGYLLSDLSFRESWEVQRRGVFGVPEMVGQAFPMGLIAEILGRHGHNMTQPVETIFQTLEANGFRYYNHNHLPPDADDVGLALRLLAYSAQPEQHRQTLQAPVELLTTAISETGDIPVWLPSDAEMEPKPSVSVSLWGNSCAAVSANVLLGLLSYDSLRYQTLIETGTRKLLQNVSQKGVGAGWHYVPLYTIWIIFELVAQLRGQLISAVLEDDIRIATQALTQRFEVEAKRHRVTPQNATLLTLICLSAGAPEVVQSAFNPNWITTLCKTQRYDGSWPGEPLYGTPTRGEFATWYASNSVTTALCYDALEVYNETMG